MIKKTLTFIVEPGDNDYDFECANRGTKLNMAIHDALENIRSRLKYGETVSNKEQQVLENLRSILAEVYIEG